MSRASKNTNSDQPKVIAVVGATATGKTLVAVELALALGGEVINADSRLFYESMDIATAKPSLAERKGIPHHVIDVVKPDQQLNLAMYLGTARRTIDKVIAREKLPIVVGGSGQYVWALLEGWEVPEIEPEPALRAELENRLSKDGIESLAQELSRIAPEVAESTDLLNPRRVTRALERVYVGSPGSTDGAELNRRKPDTPPFDALVIGLGVERSVLHQRVTDRLAAMLENGWLDEVKSLLARGYSDTDRAMSGIGYRQMIPHLAGEIDLEEAVRLTTVATNRLIRHQNNWFKKLDPRINWFDVTDSSPSTLESIKKLAESWLATDT